MMRPITDIYPQPWEVVISGRPFMVNEATVADLITLQEWLDKRRGRPLEELRGRLLSMTPAEREDALWAVYDAEDVEPPMWGNAVGLEAYESKEGIFKLFGVVLRGCQPDLGDDELKLVVSRATPAEFQDMMDAWRRSDPMAEVAELLGLPEDEHGPGIPWPQSIAEVVEATGWTLDYIRTLHMSQITAIRTGGKPKERPGSVAVMPGMGGVKGVMDWVKSRYKRLRGGE